MVFDVETYLSDERFRVPEVGIVLTYGTFDCLHHGHIKLLREAKKLGDYLIVGVSTDEFNAVKGKRARFSYDERCDMLRQLRCVDKIIPEESWGQKVEDIEQYRITKFVMGSDWNGKFDHLAGRCGVVYLPRTEGVSSSGIRGRHDED